MITSIFALSILPQNKNKNQQNISSMPIKKSDIVHYFHFNLGLNLCLTFIPKSILNLKFNFNCSLNFSLNLNRNFLHFLFQYEYAVSGALNAFLQSEKLSVGNEWKCDGCKKKVQVRNNR